MSTVQLAFPQGKYKALIFSYDDGPLADKRLVSLFNRYRLKGTFHLCDTWLDTEGKCAAQEIASLYAGHEVACHTSTHPTLTRLPLESLAAEITDNRKRLEALVQYPVKGFAYPNGAYDTSISSLLPALGIQYARTVNATGHFYMPNNWYEWHPTCHHNDALLERGEQFIGLDKKQFLLLMHIWGHSYEFDRDQSWLVMEQFCERISTQQNIWFTTHSELYNYMKCFSDLQFSADCSQVYNPFSQSVWLQVKDIVIEAVGGKVTSLN